MRNKRTYRTRLQIARYWMEWEITNGQLAPFASQAWDYDEAACMACGWAFIPANWNKSSLERCHIIPRYKGGSDEVDNLVLMCSACHARHPDWLEPEQTFKWMKARQNAWITDLMEFAGMNIRENIHVFGK